MAGVQRCTDTSSVTVISEDPWWQSIDGDITALEDVTSLVPSGQYFLDEGIGGYPGVVVYGGSLTTGVGSISPTGWNANTLTTHGRVFDYSYFERLIPDITTINDATTESLESGGVENSDGYYWYRYDGTSETINGAAMNIDSDIDLGSRKVILFVKGADLNINANINLTDGEGFLAIFVDGHIRIDPAVTGTPALEGLFVANDGFSTGDSNLPIYIRGSVVSYGGFALERDLDDNTVAAETFEFAPDQLLLFPEKLSNRRTKWTEVAP
jgi:hypothetical protein